MKNTDNNIRRSDSRNLDYYAKYLEDNGITPTGISLIETSGSKNVAAIDGGDHAQTPSFHNNGIRLSLTDKKEGYVRTASKKPENKFTRLAIDPAMARFYGNLFHEDGTAKGGYPEEIVEEEFLPEAHGHKNHGKAAAGDWFKENYPQNLHFMKPKDEDKYNPEISIEDFSPIEEEPVEEEILEPRREPSFAKIKFTRIV